MNIIGIIFGVAIPVGLLCFYWGKSKAETKQAKDKLAQELEEEKKKSIREEDK